jgi:hypothetical protein
MNLIDRYEAAALSWAKLDGVARQHEELKSYFLSRWVKARGDVPVAAAERAVKATDDWHDMIMRMVRARTEANEAKAVMEALAMKIAEAVRMVRTA